MDDLPRTWCHIAQTHTHCNDQIWTACSASEGQCCQTRQSQFLGSIPSKRWPSLLCKFGEILKFTAIEGKKMSKSRHGGNQTFLNNYPAVSGSMYNVIRPDLAAAAAWSDIWVSFLWSVVDATDDWLLKLHVSFRILQQTVAKKRWWFFLVNNCVVDWINWINEYFVPQFRQIPSY